MEISGAMKPRAAAPSLHIEKWDPPEIPEATDSSMDRGIGRSGGAQDGVQAASAAPNGATSQAEKHEELVYSLYCRLGS